MKSNLKNQPRVEDATLDAIRKVVEERITSLNFINNHLDTVNNAYSVKIIGDDDYFGYRLDLFRIYRNDKLLLNKIKEKIGYEWEGKTWEEWLAEEEI